MKINTERPLSEKEVPGLAFGTQLQAIYFLVLTISSPATTAKMDPNHTFMGPGNNLSPHYLAPPTCDHNGAKLSWRKDVRCRAKTVRACTNGSGGRAKVMFTVLGVILLRSLPTSRRKIAEKFINAGDSILDASGESYRSIVMECVEAIVNKAASDTVSIAIRKLARLSKNATFCCGRKGETMISNVERFLIPAQCYLNFVKAD